MMSCQSRSVLSSTVPLNSVVHQQQSFKIKIGLYSLDLELELFKSQFVDNSDRWKLNGTSHARQLHHENEESPNSGVRIPNLKHKYMATPFSFADRKVLPLRFHSEKSSCVWSFEAERSFLQQQKRKLVPFTARNAVLRLLFNNFDCARRFSFMIVTFFPFSTGPIDLI